MINEMKIAEEERLPPVHPGEVLLEDFTKPLGLSQYSLAQDPGCSGLTRQPDRPWQARSDR